MLSNRHSCLAKYWRSSRSVRILVKYPQEEVDLNRAIVKGDLNQVKEILNCYADLLSRKTDKLSTWLEDASEPHQLAIAEYLIEMGCDVNDEVSTPDKATPLAS